MQSDKSAEQQRLKRLRADPRRDPTIPPPRKENQDADQSAEEKFSGDDSHSSPSRETSVEDAAVENESSHATSEDRALHERNTSVVTNTDPRFDALEPLVSTADWAGVLKLLGPPEQAGKLPPNLGLIYALAAKEEGLDARSQEQQPFPAAEVAIRCMAGLVGVSPDSSVALLLAKRLLRSNPVTWRQAPAPSGKVSAIILILAGIIGGGIGWFLSLGYVTVRLPWFH